METPNPIKHFVPLFLFALLTPKISPFSPPTPPSPPSPPTPPGWGDYGDYSDYIPPPPAASCNSDDRNTLLQIKQAFNNSDVFDTWRPETDCCDGWDFVGCDPTTGRVTSFYFFGNVPYGRHDLPPIFPPAIGNLSYLTDLIFKNNATGPIPASLSNLKRLVYLDLTNNRLSGHIPQFFSGFQSLASLNLESNNFTGSIRKPLTGINFRRLNLKNNNFHGDGSFLFGKNKLYESLDLSGNMLKFNMSKIEVNSFIITLLLNNNNIFGGLPASLVNVTTSIGGFTALSNFNVSNNQLCGKIPVGGRLQEVGPLAYSNNKCLCGNPLPPCKRF